MEEREVMLLGMAAAASVEKRRACVHFEREAKTITTVYHLYLEEERSGRWSSAAECRCLRARKSVIPKKSSPEPTKLTFGSAARACKTNRVRQESGPDRGGPASGPSGGETGIEMPEMTPGRKDLGALLQGFG